MVSEQEFKPRLTLIINYSVYGVGRAQQLKPYTDNEQLLVEARPSIKFEHLPRNYCNQQHQQSGSKVRAMTLIIQDRADYTSRLTYRLKRG